MLIYKGVCATMRRTMSECVRVANCWFPPPSGQLQYIAIKSIRRTNDHRSESFQLALTETFLNKLVWLITDQSWQVGFVFVIMAEERVWMFILHLHSTHTTTAKTKNTKVVISGNVKIQMWDICVDCTEEFVSNEVIRAVLPNRGHERDPVLLFWV